MIKGKLGRLQFSLGRHLDAIPNFEAKLVQSVACQDVEAVRECHGNLACAFGALGEYRRSIQCLHEVLCTVGPRDLTVAIRTYGNLAQAHVCIPPHLTPSSQSDPSVLPTRRCPASQSPSPSPFLPILSATFGLVSGVPR